MRAAPASLQDKCKICGHNGKGKVFASIQAQGPTEHALHFEGFVMDVEYVVGRCREM